jgi:hypothetical protein
MRDNMKNRSNISQLQKNLAARDYKRRARKTYKLVKVNFHRNENLVYSDPLAYPRLRLRELSRIFSGIRWMRLDVPRHLGIDQGARHR